MVGLVNLTEVVVVEGDPSEVGLPKDDQFGEVMEVAGVHSRVTEQVRAVNQRLKAIEQLLAQLVVIKRTRNERQPSLQRIARGELRRLRLLEGRRNERSSGAAFG